MAEQGTRGIPGAASVLPMINKPGCRPVVPTGSLHTYLEAIRAELASVETTLALKAPLTHIRDFTAHFLAGEKATWAATIAAKADLVDGKVPASQLPDTGAKFIKVQSLPNVDEADRKAIYLLPRNPGEEGNLYDEYIVVENAQGTKSWDKIGSTDIDLTNYVTTDDSRLSDARTPIAHKTTHATGGTDALAPGDIGAALASRSVLADYFVRADTGDEYWPSSNVESVDGAPGYLLKTDGGTSSTIKLIKVYQVTELGVEIDPEQYIYGWTWTPEWSDTQHHIETVIAESTTPPETLSFPENNITFTRHVDALPAYAYRINAGEVAVFDADGFLKAGGVPLYTSGGTLTGELYIATHPEDAIGITFRPPSGRINLLGGTETRITKSGVRCSMRGGPSSAMFSWPSYSKGSGTFALLPDMYAAVQQIAPNFDPAATYVQNQLCTYEGVLYRCQVAKSQASATVPPDDLYDQTEAPDNHWVIAKVSELVTDIPKTALATAVQTSLDKADSAVPITGGTMTGGLTVPNLTVGSRKAGSTVGADSVAEGFNVTASEYESHAEGFLSVASGKVSHAEGVNTVAQNYAEHAQGHFNVSHKASDGFGKAGNTLSSIGCGMISAPKNAVETMQNGKTFIYGLGGYDGTNPTGTGVQDIATAINNKAPLESPAFTGTPTAPDIDAQSTDGQVANKKYVDDKVAGATPNLDYVMRVDPETGNIYYTTPDTQS